MQASAELGSQWSEVIAPQDVATYGALCSLASLTRPELRAKVVDNVQFREYLELVPEVRFRFLSKRPRCTTKAVHHSDAVRAQSCTGHVLRLAFASLFKVEFQV